MKPVSLTLTASQHALLLKHLFPEDHCEAVAIIVCGRSENSARHRLLARRVVPVPYSACSVRLPDRVTWSTNLLPPLLEEVAKTGGALVKIHGHWSYDRFSAVDDASDRALFPSVYAWANDDAPHASAIVMEDGRVFGRVVSPEGVFIPFDCVNVAGDDLHFWHAGDGLPTDVPEFGHRVAQTFGAGTYDRLRRLRAAVIGCSGTGSVVIEQLARNCVGTLLLVDPDRVEDKNLNRILNATHEDARRRRLKVNVAKRAIRAMGLGTQVETHAKTLFDADVVQAVASCDIVFGCVDTIDGRHLLNKLATFYLLPYFDLGVKIEADGVGGVDQVCGTLHYLKPDGSSLLSRRVYTLEQVRSAGLQRSDPVAYRQLLEEGYLRGVQEDRPAVIQLNSLIASLAINDLLARLHPFRLDSNAEYAIQRVSLSHGIFDHETEGASCAVLSRHVGRGDVNPLLDWAELSAA